ncbi:hypothetical protein C9439_03575 [archaeon SCG-AAA382B04]|nr:hypothetical protein C9439_03575 [archaeon SCG-AAA382B04]
MKNRLRQLFNQLGIKVINQLPLFFLFSFLIATYVLLKYHLSKTLSVFLLTYTITGSVVIYPSKKLVDWIYTRNYTYLIELRATDEGIRVFKFPNEAWKEVKVKKGELFKAQNIEKDVFFCQTFNKNSFVTTGTWRGSISGVELLKQQEKIEEVRGSLEKMARDGLAVRTRLLSIVRGAVNKIARELAQETEKDVLYKGEEIKKAVEEEIEEAKVNE